MQAENTDFESITEDRRKALEGSIKPISVEEVKKMGEGLFPFLDHPWREPFVKFVEENAASTFYHAITSDRVQILYCRAKEKGIWFLPGSGLGPLQESGLKVMKEIVDRR